MEEGGKFWRRERELQDVKSVRAARAGGKESMMEWMRRSQSASDSRIIEEVMLSLITLQIVSLRRVSFLKSGEGTSSRCGDGRQDSLAPLSGGLLFSIGSAKFLLGSLHLGLH